MKPLSLFASRTCPQLVRWMALAASLTATACGGGGGGSGGDGGVVIGGSCAAPPAGASANALAALQHLNETRAAMGSPCATMIETINTAAQKHCDYYAANDGRCVADPHSEVEGCTGFVGESFGDRVSAAGYEGIPAFEVMHFTGNGRAAVQGWIDSVWHRTPILSPWVRDVGYGGASGCDTMDFGVGSGRLTPNTVVLTYPYDGQTNVPRSFDGNEGPQPPAPPGGFPSGYPITIYVKSRLTTHLLTLDGSDAPIAHVWLAPGAPESLGLLTNEYFLYANEPLQARTRYRVRATGSSSRGPLTVDFRFTTQ